MFRDFRLDISYRIPVVAISTRVEVFSRFRDFADGFQSVSMGFCDSGRSEGIRIGLRCFLTTISSTTIIWNQLVAVGMVLGSIFGEISMAGTLVIQGVGNN